MGEYGGGGGLGAQSGGTQGTLQAQVSAAAQTGASPIIPTVFIGLGGTGLKVLARLRQRIFQRWGDPDFWPHLAFLGVDSDVKDRTQGGVDNDKGIPFRAKDIIDIGMKPQQVKSVTSQLEPNYEYAHLGRWLPRYAASYGSYDFTTGASEKRAVGRMLFVFNIKALTAALTERCNTVRSGTAVSESRNRQLQQGGQFSDGPIAPTDVVIVGSLAGGTGSGSFLDAAYLVRYLSHHQVTSVGLIRGMLVLPDVFECRDVPKPALLPIMYSNGYAALRELEYFSGKDRPGFDFRDWGRTFLSERIDAKPFDVCYLLSRDNGLKLDLASNMYDLIADTLALSVSGAPLAGTMASNWNNAQQFLNGGEYKYFHNASEARYGGPDVAMVAGAGMAEGGHTYHMFERILSTSFSSLGIASVTMKLPELRRLAATRLMRRLIDFELGDTPPDDDQEVAAIYRNVVQTVENEKNFLPERMLGDVDARVKKAGEPTSGVEAGKRAEALLNEMQRLAQDVARTPATSDVDDPPPTTPGASTVDLLDVQVLHVAALRMARDKAQGVFNALNGLKFRKAHHILQKVIAGLSAPRQDTMPEVDLDKVVVKQWHNLDSTGLTDVFGLGSVALGIIRRNFRAWLTEDCRKFREHMNHSLYRHYRFRVVELLRERQKLIAGASSDLQTWSADLHRAQGELVKHFQDSHNEPLTNEWAALPDSAEETRLLDPGIDAALSAEWFPDVQVSPADLLQKARDQLLIRLRVVYAITPNTLLETRRVVVPEYPEASGRMVDLIARHILGKLPANQDVFQEMLNKGKGVNTVLANIGGRANAYWPVSAAGRDNYQRTTDPVSQACAAVSPKPTPQQVAAIQTLQGSGYAFVHAPAAFGSSMGELALVNEVHGIGLPSFGPLALWRQFYINQGPGKLPDRHLSDAISPYLPDLMPVTVSEAQDELQAWDTAFQAIVLGFFNWNAERQTFIYVPEVSQRLDMGDSYDLIARRLRTVLGVSGYKHLTDRINQEYAGRLGAVEKAKGDKAAEALKQARFVKRLDLVMELLKKHAFRAHVQGAHATHHPPDHVMIRRIQWRIHDGCLKFLYARAGVTDGQMRAELVHHLHHFVRFVGPPPAAPSTLVRVKRILQLTTETQQGGFSTAVRLEEEGSRAVLHEAHALGWFAGQPDLVVPERVKTLFPDDAGLLEDDEPDGASEATPDPAPPPNSPARDVEPPPAIRPAGKNF